ncbi:MAG: tetratricopeptide repeat protein [Candidatus Omnitrophica bacterium]|nr:tetratricopeptide repeat protein [Candidatus Omnitrophota bacterium]
MQYLNKRYVQILFIVFVSLIAYSNTFHAPFTFDTIPHIPDNPIIKDLKNFFSGVAYREYPRRFVGYFTLALDYYLGGTSVVYYHVTNLIIHIFCGILVYWLVVLTLRTQLTIHDTRYKIHDKKRASCIMHPASGQADSPIHQFTYSPIHSSKGDYLPLFVALLFVSHPLQTEAVTYIIQRFTSLSTMFYLLSVLMYINGRLAGFKQPVSFLYYFLSIFSAILAMKTKEIAVSIPISIIIYDLFFFKTPAKKRLLLFLPLMLTIVIVPLGVLYHGQSLKELFIALLSYKAQTNMPRSMYLFTQFRVIVTYIRLIFFPVNQCLDYPFAAYRSFFSTPVVFSFLFLLSIVLTSFYLLYYSSRHRSPYARLISFGILWFFVTIAPQSSIIPIVDVIFEHRVYLSSVGVFIAIAFASGIVWNRLHTKWRNRLAVGAAAGMIAILTTATFVRNTVWQSELSLWEDVIKKFPDNARSLNNLSAAYIDAGRYEDGIKSSRKVLQFFPDNANAYNNIGYAYFKLGKLNEAKDAMGKAIENKPDFARAYSNIVVVYILLSDYKKALEAVGEEIKLSPSASAYNNLSVIYQRLGRYPEAMHAATEAVNIKSSMKMVK